MKLKRKSLATMLSAFVMLFVFALGVQASTINPSVPGDSPATAWAFSNSMDITQPFRADQLAHIYRLNVSGMLDNTFSLTITTPVGVPVELWILNLSGDAIRPSITSNGGQHQETITLATHGTFFVRVENSGSVDGQTYRLQLRPISPPGINRTPYDGHTVSISNGRLVVDGRTISGFSASSSPINLPGHPSHLGTTHWSAGHLTHVHSIRVGRLSNIPWSGGMTTVNGNVVEVSKSGVIESIWSAGGNWLGEHVTDGRFFYFADTGQWFHVQSPALGFATFFAQSFTDRIPASQPVNTAHAPQGLSIDFNNESISGAGGALMQLSTNNGASWSNFAYPFDISNRIPAFNRPDASILVRYAASSMFLASEPVELIIPARTAAAPTSAMTRFDGFTETIILNDTMEYRQGTAGAWIAVGTGQTSIPVAFGERDTYQVRFAGDATGFASPHISVTVPARRVAPNAVYAPASDSITGVSTTSEFSLDGGFTWERVVGSSIPRATLGFNATTVHVRLVATAAHGISHVRVIDVPQGPSASPTGFAIDFAREVVTGVATGMQRSTNGTAWTNIIGNELDIASLIPAATANNSTLLRIRYAPTATTPPSEAYIIPLIPRAATPTTAEVRFDGFSEVLIFNDTMEYRQGTSGAWISVSPGQTSMPVSIGTSNTTWQVRVRGTYNQFPSALRSATSPARPTAPRATYNIVNDEIRSVSTAMEFSIGSPNNWMDVNATTISRSEIGNNATSVYIRTRATQSVPHGWYVVIAVPDAVSAPTTNFEINFENELLTGLTTEMEFATRQYTTAGIPATTALRWNRITQIQADNGIDLTPFIPTFHATSPRPMQVFVRYAADGTNSASNYELITLSPRPRTPAATAIAGAVRFYGPTETIIVGEIDGNAVAFEFRAGTAGVWTLGAGDSFSVTPNLSTGVVQTYQVRVATNPASNMFASLPFNVTVPRRPAAPEASAIRVRYDAITDSVRGVAAAMQFSTVGSNGPWNATGGTSIDRSALGAGTTEIWVRIAPTATAPASPVTHVTGIHAGVAAPTGIYIDWIGERLTGVTPAMQISVNGGSSWLNLVVGDGAGQVNAIGICITSRIPSATTANPTQILVRYAATANTPTSTPTTAFVLPQRPAQPVAADHRFDAVNRLIPTGFGMQVSDPLNASGTWRDVFTTSYAPIAGTARTIQVRIAPIVGLSFGSLARSISVPVIATQGTPLLLPITDFELQLPPITGQSQQSTLAEASGCNVDDGYCSYEGKDGNISNDDPEVLEIDGGFDYPVKLGDESGNDHN